jgi:hypothetical protein
MIFSEDYLVKKVVDEQYQKEAKEENSSDLCFEKLEIVKCQE